MGGVKWFQTWILAAELNDKTLLPIWRTSAMSRVAFRERLVPMILSSHIDESA